MLHLLHTIYEATEMAHKSPHNVRIAPNAKISRHLTGKPVVLRIVTRQPWYARVWQWLWQPIGG